MSNYESTVASIARCFKEDFEKAETYEERMFVNEKYSSQVHDLSNYLETTLFPKRMSKLYAQKTRGKRVLLIGASVPEIKMFARYATTVHFISLPHIDTDLPSNVTQIDYLGDYKEDYDPEEMHGTIDFAFSHHLVEHISPLDVHRHFMVVSQMLKRGGVYYFVCPSKWNIERMEPAQPWFQAFHVGRYGYKDIKEFAEYNGFEFQKCLVNPSFLDYYTRMDLGFAESFAPYLEPLTLAILGIDSLYVKLTKKV